MTESKNSNIHEWRLFNEFEFAEPPDWIPFLPKPGEFDHAAYGKVAITPERNVQFVNNFKNGIYQTQLPIDAEHQTKLSGAMGWVRDMRVNDDGSADAKVEWTDRGKAMLTENRFKYFSPEFFETWTDPATGKQHQDVAIGGALTTRPFFKESSLRPLVASERGLFAADAPVTPETTTVFFSSFSEVQMAEKTEVQPVTTQQFTELQQQFNEVKSALAASEAKRAETEQEAKRFAEALDKSNERIALMEAADQRRRFSEICKDWHGKPESNINLLVKMAEAFGEDSVDFGDFVINQNAIAAQLAESSLFKEIGTSRSDTSATPGGKIEALAKQIATERNVPFAQAMTLAAEQNPQLYSEYVNAHRKGF